MNVIERYLQAQSRMETLTRYYSYPLNMRTRPTPMVQLVSYFLWPGYKYKLLDEVLGPQNVPERSTACELFSQWDLGKER